MEDIAKACYVQVEFDGKTLWVNVHGQCRLRIGEVSCLHYIAHGELVYTIAPEADPNAE